MADVDLARTKPGFAKIAQTCHIARELNHGIRYAWVDTCCIDKSSSAELTEAINSMFRWYKNSTVCIVYLSDLSSSEHRNVMKDDFPRCKWFTRGWTLQELIAPQQMIFFDKDWKKRGEKAGLRKEISKITKIDIEILENSDLLSTISIAKRMSWAASRRTSRVEDLSYCLFGLFDIQLPLIYGEGTKAFIRLQEAIASETTDLSLFAWTSTENDQDLRGILARSPSEFERCGTFQRDTSPDLPRIPFTMTNKGFHVTTRLGRGKEGIEDDYQLNLHCFDSSRQQTEGTHGTVVIYPLKTAQSYVRRGSNKLAVVSYADIRPSEEHPIYIPKIISPRESHLINSGLSSCFALKIINTSVFSCNVTKLPKSLWDPRTQAFITDGHENFTGLLIIKTVRIKEDPVTTLSFDGGVTCKPSHWKANSKYVAVFGLEKFNGIVQSGVAEDHTTLRPWAAIYEWDDEESICQILSQEDAHGFPQVLARIRALLRLRASSSRGLPANVTTIPSWRIWKGKYSEYLGLQSVDKGSIRIHVSTNVNNQRGRDMFEVVVDISEHNLSSLADLRLAGKTIMIERPK